VVDDYEPWRGYTATALQAHPNLQIIGEAADGLQAVRRAEELQPNLILLDIVLPKLNGIEAARRIRQVSPRSKVLFASVDRYAEVIKEALRAGANGYLLKSDAGSELLLAVRAVLEDKRFVSTGLHLAADDSTLDASNGNEL